MSRLQQDLGKLVAQTLHNQQLDTKMMSWRELDGHTIDAITEAENLGSEDWDRVRSRFGPNSKMAAWTHPLVPSGMVMHARVELLKEKPRTIEQLTRMCLEELTPDARAQSAFPSASVRNPAVACLHSFHKSHVGLIGVDFGSFLVKQLLLSLKQTNPHLQRFVTVSPLPGYRRWLQQELSGVSDSPKVLAAFDTLPSDMQMALLKAAPGRDGACSALNWLLKRPNWWTRDGIHLPPVAADAGLQLVYACCQQYLQSTAIHERSGRRRAIDPVANFHLRNGAVIATIVRHLETDSSMRPAYGLQVQYEYIIDDIESNNLAYVNDGKIALSPALKSTWMDGVASLPQAAKFPSPKTAAAKIPIKAPTAPKMPIRVFAPTRAPKIPVKKVKPRATSYSWRPPTLPVAQKAAVNEPPTAATEVKQPYIPPGPLAQCLDEATPQLSTKDKAARMLSQLRRAKASKPTLDSLAKKKGKA